jgi:hypothetical protein
MAFGANGFATLTSVAGSAVMHIRPQHFPSDECGAFAGIEPSFSATGLA